MGRYGKGGYLQAKKEASEETRPADFLILAL